MKQKQINQNWKEFELGSLCDLVTDGTHEKTPLVGKNEGMPLITSKDLTENGLSFEKALYITKEQHEQIIRRSNPRKGDVLYSKIGTIGKPTLIEVDTEFSIKNIALFKPKNELLYGEYFVYSLEFCHNKILNIAGGVTQKFIPLSKLKQIKIPIPILPDGTPDLKKQKQIVAILEKAEALKDKRKNLDDLFDEYLKSIFYEMFLRGDFEIKELESVCNIIMGQSPSGDSYNEKGEGIPFFQGKTEFGEKYTTNKKYTTKPTKFAKKNNILMSVRAPVGSVNFANCDCCIGRGLCSFEPHNDLLNDYLYYYFKLNEDKIAGMGTGSTFKAITGKQIRSLKLPIPPIPLQKNFLSIVAQVEKIKNKLKDEKKDGDELFNVLMQKAFSGELI